MSRERLVASVEALLAVIFWGGSFIATKIALRDVSPVTAVWLRFAMGWVILGITVFLRGQFALPKRRDVRYLALLGFLGITFHQWLQSTGLLTSQASTTAWIVATTPVFMAILQQDITHVNHILYYTYFYKIKYITFVKNNNRKEKFLV